MSNYTVRFDFLRETSVAAWESILIGGRVGSTCGIMVTQVCLWFGAFGNGRTVLRASSGHDVTPDCCAFVLASAAVTEDRRIHSNDFARLLDISPCAAHIRSIVHGQLGYRKV